MTTEAVPEGYVTDFISGQQVRATPEEVEAVQVFARRLVDEYGYPKKHIVTHPQYRIKSSPSGEERYPVDIAAFNSTDRAYDNLYLIVECKRKNRTDGERQLKIYMGLSAAQIGVWFNGQEHLYIQKVLDQRGNVSYRELPNIPKYGQRVEDVGRFKRSDLRAPTNLRAVFRDIRNHLAGMTTGITRDEALARELINILFCKVYDEINTPLGEEVAFRAGVFEAAEAVKNRIIDLFEDKVKPEYDDVFDQTDAISLDADSLMYVVGELQNYAILEAERDAIADAFETFIGPALRGSEGQFFTPRNVVHMMVDILDPQPGQLLIDPACGSGGFLIAALERVWRKLEEQGRDRGWKPEMLARQKAEVATRYFRGIDKDSFLAKVTKAYMAIVGDGRGGVFCENTLKLPDEWDPRLRDKVKLESFDIVITNPPFGSKIQVRGDNILTQYELADRWNRDRTTGGWTRTGKLHDRQAPQVLFVERCLQLLKPGGKMGIVLPESIFGNPSHGYIVSFLESRAKITGIVSMPEDLFQPHTHNKTCVVFLEKSQPTGSESIFMGVVKWCGHDSRGNAIPYDDVPKVADAYADLQRDPTSQHGRYGFLMNLADIQGGIFIPKYYDPEIRAELNGLRDTHDLITIRELVSQKVLSIATGDEIGKLVTYT